MLSKRQNDCFVWKWLRALAILTLWSGFTTNSATTPHGQMSWIATAFVYPQGSSSRDRTAPLQLTSAKAQFNFGPATFRPDCCLFTAERPGNTPNKEDPISTDAIMEWIQFVKSQGITRVTALLDDNELLQYPTEPGLLETYRQHSLDCERVSMSSPQAKGEILKRIQDAQEANEKMVVHCTGGIGRCGRVAAAWLVHHYGLSYDEATTETLETAQKFQTIRKGDAKMLQEWYEAAV